MDTERQVAITTGTDDWASRLAGLLERVTFEVERKTVRPARLVSRALVYGLLAAVALPLALALGSIGVLRLLNTYVFVGRDWASFLLLGAMLCLLGLVLWSLRTGRRKEKA